MLYKKYLAVGIEMEVVETDEELVAEVAPAHADWEGTFVLYGARRGGNIMV
jgi:hypothetical protein